MKKTEFKYENASQKEQKENQFTQTNSTAIQCNICHGIHHDASDTCTHDSEFFLPRLELLLEKINKDLINGAACDLIFIIANGINEIAEHHGLTASQHVKHILATRIHSVIAGIGLAAAIHGGLFAAGCDDKDSGLIAEEFWEKLNKPILWKNETLHLHISIGLAKSDRKINTAEALLQAGYAAAIQGKKNNHSPHVFLFTSELGQHQAHQYKLKKRLRKALEQDGLSIAFQAKINAKNRELVGAEVLARWRDSQLGLVPPSEFISAAETNGMITTLS